MLDGGAQVSLIKADFLKKIFEKENLDTENFKISPKSRNVVDINGKRVGCYGVIMLQIVRKDCEPVNVHFHITDAPIGPPILFGTNALGLLGFKIFDSQNGELLEFECLNDQSDSVRIIYSTVLEPRSTKYVELLVPKNFEEKEVIIAANDESDFVRVEPSIGKVQNGKVIAAVTNFLPNAVTLKENDQIATAEIVEEFADAENCFEESWLFNSSPLNTDTVQKCQINAE
ncbi:hypothetical protein niasHT_031240 [Heterodera trifolii]|uniref:Peptidase A2 domain-containing protein n=1 Tax=Heterodera trifolii TaxID=157864 RepID=A0ABD2IUI5_9BILA